MTGATIWLTGLPCAGKTTIASAVVRGLKTRTERPSQILDGDVVRQHLSQDLGYSRADRDINVRRIGWVGRMLAHHGILCIAAVVSPYAESRDAVRRYHETADVPFFEVYVSTPLDVCRRRDVKGLYARNSRGEIVGLTGVDDPYEPPARPELTVDASSGLPEECAEKILDLLPEGWRGGSR